MKNLKRELQAVNKQLNGLMKKIESLIKAADKIEKSQATKGKKTPAIKKTSKLTDTDKVLNIIKMSKKGVSAQVLCKKTGFNAKKIANIVFRVSKAGKIKSVGKGIYMGA